MHLGIFCIVIRVYYSTIFFSINCAINVLTKSFKAVKNHVSNTQKKENCTTYVAAQTASISTQLSKVIWFQI